MPIKQTEEAIRRAGSIGALEKLVPLSALQKKTVLAEVVILGPSDRRRVWNTKEKAALLAEVDTEGGKVRLMARRHGIPESLLYNWPSARKAAPSRRARPRMVTSFRLA